MLISLAALTLTSLLEVADYRQALERLPPAVLKALNSDFEKYENYDASDVWSVVTYCQLQEQHQYCSLLINFATPTAERQGIMHLPSITGTYLGGRWETGILGMDYVLGRGEAPYIRVSGPFSSDQHVYHVIDLATEAVTETLGVTGAPMTMILKRNDAAFIELRDADRLIRVELTSATGDMLDAVAKRIVVTLSGDSYYTTAENAVVYELK